MSLLTQASSPSSLAWAVLVGAAFVLLILRHLSKSRHLTDLPGPSGGHWLLGHEWEIYSHSAGEMWNRWVPTYGTVFKYRNAFFNGSTIVVADPAAIKAILIDGPDGTAFHKPLFNRQTNQRLLGKGVIWAEGKDHRHQRRLLSPAFSLSSIEAVSGAFYTTADNIKDAWNQLLDTKGAKSVTINVAEFMSSAALDVIGAAGFQHHFDAVKSATKEASDITEGLTAALGSQPTFKMFITLNLAKSFPRIFNYAPLKAIRNQRESKATIDRVAYKVLKRVEKEETESDAKSILAFLLKERKKGNSLTDAEIVDNISTMITAGHETTGITLSLVLYELARDPKLQDRVRRELIGDRSLPTFEELQRGEAPLLDAVIKEVLRYYPANIRIIRTAEKDSVVPLSRPVRTHSGEVNQIVIPKGTDILFPLTAINRLDFAWGADADQFLPDRWIEPGRIPEAVKELPAGLDHIFTFVAGPRACIGMRFALAEMRVILAAVIASFSFRMAHEDPLDIVSPAQIMIRAQDTKKKVYGVPLLISRVA